MSGHTFDPLTQVCEGCGQTQEAIEDPERAKDWAFAEQLVRDLKSKGHTVAEIGLALSKMGSKR